MLYNVYDNPEEKGVDIEFDFENGFAITIFMEDDAAQQLVNIVQNKLNSRC